MIPQLVNRWKDKNTKSALLVTSTLGSHAPCSGFTLYCGTKIFANYIVQGLFTEFKDQVDIMAYTPGWIITKMAQSHKTKTDYETITSEYAADVYFRDVGISAKSGGAFRHEYGIWAM